MTKFFYILCAVLLMGITTVDAQQFVRRDWPAGSLSARQQTGTRPVILYERASARLAARDFSYDCDSIVLHSQQEVDNFRTDHPGCTTVRKLRIDGADAPDPITRLDSLSDITRMQDLVLSNTHVPNLSTFVNLTQLDGWLFFEYDDAVTTIDLPHVTSMGLFILESLPNLTTLAGLTDQFTNTGLGTVVVSNTGVTDLTGLERIESLPNLYVTRNQHITSTYGLHNLNSCDYGISVNDNPLLTDLSSFQQILHINEASLECMGNASLTSMSGFSNITDIGAGLYVERNNVLTDMALNSALAIENKNGTNEVSIRDNPQLAVCSSTPICAYISGGGAISIENNAPGCTDLNEVSSQCTYCSANETITWNGSDDDRWNNAANWDLGRVPTFCDKVYIPDGTANQPVAELPVVIHGLKMDANTSLDMAGYSLICYGDVDLQDCFIDGFGSFQMKNNELISIQGTTIYADEVVITNYTGDLDLIGSELGGNLTISDNEERTGTATIYDNSVWGNFEMTMNSTRGEAQTDLGNNNGTGVDGNVTLNSITGSVLNIGNAGALRVGGDLRVNSIIPNTPTIQAVEFYGFNDSHIQQTGTEPIRMNELRTEKWSTEYSIYLDQQVEILGDARFGGGLVRTTASAPLVFAPGSYVSQFSSGSWVKGPVVKAGGQSFRFPTGDTQRQAVIDVAASGDVNDSLTVEYFQHDPSIDGYDVDQHEASLTTVSPNEYWSMKMNRAAAMNITLQYDSARSKKVSSPYSLRVGSWNGSEWENKGASNIQGNGEEYFVSSGVPVSATGIYTFGLVEPARIPVISVGEMDTAVCRGTYVKVPVDVDTVMLSSNVFTVQLSDQIGSFAAPATIATKTAYDSDTLYAYIPSAITLGAGYRIRVLGSMPTDTSVNTRAISVYGIPTQSFFISGADTGCSNSAPRKYFVSNREFGVEYNWTVSGGGVLNLINDTAYVTWPTAGGYSIGVTTSTRCGVGPWATKWITVSYGAPVAAPALIKSGRWLYASSPAPEQHATYYNWYRNGTLIPGISGASYYAQQAGSYTVRFANNCGEGAASNSISYAANSVSQTITFDPVPDMHFGDSPYTLHAVSSSNLPVALSIISGPGNLSGSVYTTTAPGTVVIRATQPGDDVYDTAAFVVRTFTVNKATQVINFLTIPDQLLGNNSVALSASVTSGLPLSFNVVSGPAYLSGTDVVFTGIGTVTVAATQPGNSNFEAAPTAQQSFCVRINDLDQISGPLFVCPGQSGTYTINSVAGLTYSWRLTNGTTYPSTSNSVTINWPSSGTYTLVVSATGPCGAPTANDSLTVEVVTAVSPAAVSNMLPADGATGQQLPLALSWIPGGNTLSYDLFVWDSATTRPSQPFAADLTSLSYTIPAGALPYHTTYKWQVVSKNGCLQTDGPVQTFRLKTLPDLVVSEVQAPTAAFSGQTITVSWTVKNAGPGNTTTNQSWTDAVFFSFDTHPNFSISPETSSSAWSQLTFPVRPLLAGTRQNVSALDSGQQYQNSINFTLPYNYSQPIYAYVITNYPAGSAAPAQMTVVNDTARAPQPIAVTLSPTPDLRVDTVFTPSSAFSGSTISVTYKVKNYGALTPAGSSWNDKIYISSSPFFSVSNSVLLKGPKSNGSYYSFAPDAVLTNNTQLQQDSSYTRSAQVVLPNFISGTYFIYVMTNSDNSLYEGAASGNNAGQAQMQLFLTPTPLLTVNSLTVPVTTASVTQSIGINWNIYNAGFNDNIEKSKGHYFVANGSCTTAPGPGASFRDSLGFGSSYWLDRVYLSTDAVALNTASAVQVGEVAHGVQNSGLSSPDNTRPDLCLQVGVDAQAQNINTSDAILPESNYPRSLTISVPADLPEGNYYVWVLTNATRTVYEYPGTPQTRRSALPLTVQRPDLVVPRVSIPAALAGGQSFTISYDVKNTGSGAVFNATRNDRFYASSSNVFDGSAVLIGSKTFTEDIAAGATVSHDFAYTFPPATSGTRYVYVQTNYDSTFRETTMANNTSAGAVTVVSNATPADLVVSSFPLADTVGTLSPVQFRYTVTNTGSGTTIGSRKDSLFISCSPVFNSATAYYIGRISDNTVLAPGASIADSVTLSLQFGYDINNCFPKQLYSTAYFFVKVNSDNGIYEGTNTANNIVSSGARVLFNPMPDHVVTKVTAPATATVARPYAVNWTVKNIGFNPGSLYYSSWYDVVYFSPDSLFSAGTAVASPTFVIENTRLNNGQTYSDTRSVVVPDLPTGDYYVLVNTNAFLYFTEPDLVNNVNAIRDVNGKAIKIHVTRPLLPDLVDSILSSPVTAATGQPLTVIHQVKNSGAGETFPGNWGGELWLSADLVPGNTGDIQLAGVNHSGVLQAGESYMDTLTGTMPLNTVPGNYALISIVNRNRSLIETNFENDTSYRFVTVYSPAPSDLVVKSIIIPDTAYLGYSIDTVRWVIGNQSANAATGVSSDGLYILRSNQLDSTAQLLTVVNKTLALGPLGNDSLVARPIVTVVPEGDYYIGVRTDLRNNIPETNKLNNSLVSATRINIKAKVLLLEQPEPNTLQQNARYYRLNIPPALRGATVLVTLKSSDSLTMKNELFIGGSYVPSPAQFDYRFENPNYGNQQILMDAVTDSVYYIMYRSVSPNPVVQQVTLKATVLPFTILNVQANSGGNIGNVTIRISGSLFVPGMQAFLNSGSGVIAASTVYFSNSTSVYATFNLQGRPLGVYDVKLVKQDASEAVLPNSFTIVAANNGGLITGGGNNTGQSGSGNSPGCDPGAPAGYNSQLVTEVVAPEKVFGGWPFIIQINYSNPTNYDIPAQVRTLYADKGVLLGATNADLANGNSSLHLELTEPGGPPGIIRAGGSGSITVYAKAPLSIPGHTHVIFTLK